jgi:tetrahydromethanopterin S-methyltransferase subunit A
LASVATAPNNSSDDHSGTEIDDREEEHQEEEIAKESDSDATVMKDLGKDSDKNLIKIAELQKKKKKTVDGPVQQGPKAMGR